MDFSISFSRPVGKREGRREDAPVSPSFPPRSWAGKTFPGHKSALLYENVILTPCKRFSLIIDAECLIEEIGLQHCHQSLLPTSHYKFGADSQEPFSISVTLFLSAQVFGVG